VTRKRFLHCALRRGERDVAQRVSQRARQSAGTGKDKRRAKIWESAFFSLTTGGFNTAVGFFSLRSDTTGQLNTAIGAGTLLANTADQNTVTGAGALLSNTIGDLWPQARINRGIRIDGALQARNKAVAGSI
jgi:hypothetical protein